MAPSRPAVALAAIAAALTVAVPVVAARQGRVVVLRDVAYAAPEPAAGRGHLLDLYLPPGDPRTGPGRPLLVWSGGSGWMSDDGKASAEPIARHFTARGWAVAGVSVRSSGQAVFPAQVHDVKSAIRWLRANADRHGLDPDRVAVMGDSSGGWLAAMAAVTGAAGELEGDVGVTGPSSAVQAAVDLYGPADFLAMDAQMLPGACERFNAGFGLRDCHDDPSSPESRLMGFPIRERPDLVARASPAFYASMWRKPATALPPMLIMHGRDDDLVPEPQSASLYEALRAAGAPVRYVPVPGAGHSWRQVLAGGRMDDVAAFLEDALGVATAWPHRRGR
jgi:acetyl esterase/lipase